MTDKSIKAKFDDLAEKSDVEIISLLAPELVSDGMTEEEAIDKLQELLKEYREKDDSLGTKFGVANNPVNRVNTLRDKIADLSRGYF